MNVNTKELIQNMRRVVVKQLCSQCVLSEPCYDMDNGCFFDQAANIIEELTAADMKPVVKAVWKHVKWVVDEEWQEGGYWISRCSNCSMPYHTETPFCPHCGADMRPEEGE